MPSVDPSVSKRCRLLLSTIAAIAIAIQSCQPSAKIEEAADTTKAVDHTAVDTPIVPDSVSTANSALSLVFIRKAALANLLEIELAKLANEKARDFKVREFGKLMYQDHIRMAEALEVLASAKDMKLPVSLISENSRQIEKMKKMAFDRFETAYMKLTIENHKKTIDLFKEAVNSKDPRVASFAGKFIPVLESHRERALEVRAHLKTEAEKSLLPLLP